MLHAAIINFRRRIVNRTRGFSCRAAAQFNPGIEVLRWDSGGETEGLRILRIEKSVGEEQIGRSEGSSCPQVREEATRGLTRRGGIPLFSRKALSRTATKQRCGRRRP